MITDAYLAGLFDGEGCITTSVHRMTEGYKCYNVQVVAAIGMGGLALPLLMHIQTQYGGNLSKTNTRSAVHLKWQARAGIIEVLGKIEPHMILKREQVKLALWWAEMAIVDPTAKDMFLADLKAMKGNMLLTADATIKRIQDHLRPLYSNVVRIR